MSRPTWKAWHEVVQLRDELKTGELPNLPAVQEFSQRIGMVLPKQIIFAIVRRNRTTVSNKNWGIATQFSVEG